MIFLRTAFGIVLVACLVALAGLGYRLWQVQRQMAVRLRALEARQAVSTEADVAAIHACYDRLQEAVLGGGVASAGDLPAYPDQGVPGSLDGKGSVLVDVRVQGDTATGQELRVANGLLTARPISFRRMEGRWRVERRPNPREVPTSKSAAGR